MNSRRLRPRLVLLVLALVLAPPGSPVLGARPAFAQVALSEPRPRVDEVEALRARTREAPRDAAAWAEYGRALMARDTVDDRLAAQVALKRAVALAPEDVDYRLTLAELYTRQNYLTLARRQLAAALRTDQDLGPADHRLGRLALRDWLKFQRRPALDTARRHWQEAARRMPHEPEPWLGLGVLALLDGHPAGAVTAAREARAGGGARSAPVRGETYLLEGAGAYGLGRAAAADSAFRAALPLLAGPISDRLLDITPAAADADTVLLGGLADSGARERFLATFWKSRDPDLTTGYNEVQLEMLSRGALAYFLFYDAKQRTWDERGNYLVRYGAPDSTDYNPPALPGGSFALTRSTTNHLVWHYRRLGFLVMFEEQYLNGRYDVPWSLHEVVDFVPNPDSLDPRVASGEVATAGRGVFRTTLPGSRRLVGYPELALFRRVAGFDPRTSVASATLSGGGGGPAGRVEAYLAIEGGARASLLGLEAAVYEDSTFREVARARSRDFAWCLSETVQVAQFNFDLPAGRYVVGLAARDSVTGASGAWRLPVTVPPIRPGRVELSDLELACSREAGPRASAFNKIEGAIIPNPRRQVARDQPFGVYFEIYNLVTDASGRSRVSFEYAIRSTRKDRRPFFVKVVNPRRNDPLVRVERSDEVPGRARFQYVTADVAGQAPGPYRIEVTVTDETTGVKATRGVDFELVD